MRHLFAVLAGGLLLLSGAGMLPLLAVAQQPPDSIRNAALRDFHGPDLEGKDGPLAKAGLDLLVLYHEYRAYQEGGNGRGDIRSADAPKQGRGFNPSIRGARLSDGRVTIEAIAAENPDSLRRDLEGLGLAEGATAGNLVSGRIPIGQIPAMAKLESLRRAALSRMQTRTDDPRTTSPSPSPDAPKDSSLRSDDTIQRGDSASTDSTVATESSTETEEGGSFSTGLALGVVIAVFVGIFGFLLWR